MSTTSSTMKKSVSKRIRVTRTGKLIRRKMGQGHFKAKRSGGQKRAKRKNPSVHSADVKLFKKYL